MIEKQRVVLAAMLLMIGLFPALARAQADDVADVPSQDLRAGGEANMRYFLIGAGDQAPPGGFGLLLVLPGGDGSAQFAPFVKRIYQNALPDGYLVAQLVAVPWTPKQQTVWPTVKSRVAGGKFTTEQFVEAVIADVKAKYAVDARRIFTLSWSSGGPAAYAASLQDKTAVTGSFVAMSVFKPQDLPVLSRAKGRAYYILHSRQDRTCPFVMATRARDQLGQAGAAVQLVEYAGGHGWASGDPFGDIRSGIEWLQSVAATGPTTATAGAGAGPAAP